MAVGRRSRNESKRRCGEVEMRRRIRSMKLLGKTREVFAPAARLAARYVALVDIHKDITRTYKIIQTKTA